MWGLWSSLGAWVKEPSPSISIRNHPPSPFLQRLPDAAVDSFMDDLEGGEFPEGRTARMFLGCALLRLPAQVSQRLQYGYGTDTARPHPQLHRGCPSFFLPFLKIGSFWMSR